MIKTKRIYEPWTRDDGYRVLVDRIWPRGMTKEKARFKEWLKDVAPSTELRKWFGHDPRKRAEFKKRYFKELKARKDLTAHLKSLAKKGTVTLLYSAKDEEMNNAVALKAFLEKR